MVNPIAEKERLEWLFLADGAQIAGNKLYLLGAGWDMVSINAGFPAHLHMALAAAFRVPWTATNEKHTFEITIVNEDRNETLVSMAGEFEVGRPPGIPAGSAQRSQIAAEMMAEFQSAGQYVVRVRLNGEDLSDQEGPFREVTGPGSTLHQGSQSLPSEGDANGGGEKGG